jgi:uncharacterized membrane protein YkoI
MIVLLFYHWPTEYLSEGPVLKSMRHKNIIIGAIMVVLVLIITNTLLIFGMAEKKQEAKTYQPMIQQTNDQSLLSAPSTETKSQEQKTTTPQESFEPSEPSFITEEEAKEIALKRVSGKVTDIDIERKFGKETWVVEIDPTSGPETDVIIDMQTGKVLGIED